MKKPRSEYDEIEWKNEVKHRVKNLDGTGLFGTEGGFGKGLFVNEDSSLQE